MVLGLLSLTAMAFVLWRNVYSCVVFEVEMCRSMKRTRRRKTTVGVDLVLR